MPNKLDFEPETKIQLARVSAHSPARCLANPWHTRRLTSCCGTTGRKQYICSIRDVWNLKGLKLFLYRYMMINLYIYNIQVIQVHMFSCSQKVEHSSTHSETWGSWGCYISNPMPKKSSDETLLPRGGCAQLVIQPNSNCNQKQLRGFLSKNDPVKTIPGDSPTCT